MSTAYPSYVLSTACPDTTGVVASISGFLARHNGLITEAQPFDDPFTDTSFMRTVFHDNGQGLPALESRERAFREEVAERFAMRYVFREQARKVRVVVAVSRYGHCLNSLLHRWSAIPPHPDRGRRLDSPGHAQPRRMARSAVPLLSDRRWA